MSCIGIICNIIILLAFTTPRLASEMRLFFNRYIVSGIPCMVIALNYPHYYNGPCLMDDGSFLLIFINTVCMGKGTLASQYTNLVF